jgi:hypothetical protein
MRVSIPSFVVPWLLASSATCCSRVKVGHCVIAPILRFVSKRLVRGDLLLVWLLAEQLAERGLKISHALSQPGVAFLEGRDLGGKGLFLGLVGVLFRLVA